MDYKHVLKLLEIERNKMISVLRNNDSKEAVLKKKEFDFAIAWLQIGQNLQISPKSKIVALPEQQTKTPSSEFRIIEDHESDNNNDWVELIINEEKIRPTTGDLLILKD